MARAEVTTIPHSQGKLAVYTWGEGPMVLLVHGWENSASHMANFVQPLLEHGFRVVACDAPALQKMQQLIFQRFGFSVEYFSIERMAEIIDFPGLIIHDRDDDVVPFSDAETIVKHWPQSRLLATETLGHRKILYNRQIIEEVVNFLAT